MFNNEIFDKWLDKETDKVIEKLADNGKLESEDKLILMLKAQTNHFYHLDKEIRGEIELFKKESKRYWEENEKRWEENGKRWEQNEKRWEENQKEFKRIYETIQTQTWKIIGTIGAFIAISQLIGSYTK